MSGSNASKVSPIVFFPKNPRTDAEGSFRTDAEEGGCGNLGNQVGDAVHSLLSENNGFAGVPEFYESFLQKDADSAMRKILSAGKRLAVSEDVTLREYVLFLKNHFVRGESSLPEALWTELRDSGTLKSAIISYCREYTPKIFATHHRRSLYDEIEFGLFLLGADELFDVVNDIEKGGAKGINALFNEQLIQIAKDLRPVRFEMGHAGVRLVDENEIHGRFERNIAAFEQLCELVNKLAALKSVNTMGKECALSLSRMIGGYLETLERHLSEVGYDPEILERFHFIKGKLLGNYSCLEYFDGKSAIEIEATADRICQSTIRGFELQKRSGF
jgi:hypothetical protein